MSDSRKELEEIQNFIRTNSEVIKPNFGVLFWQLSTLEDSLTPDEFAKQGLNLDLQEANDEIVAEFLAAFIKFWQDSDDLNAASRFFASRLNMSADELLQTRQIFLDSQK